MEMSVRMDGLLLRGVSHTSRVRAAVLCCDWLLRWISGVGSIWDQGPAGGTTSGHHGNYHNSKYYVFRKIKVSRPCAKDFSHSSKSRSVAISGAKGR